MRNFRLDDESGHQEALFSWAAYRTGLIATSCKGWVSWALHRA